MLARRIAAVALPVVALLWSAAGAEAGVSFTLGSGSAPDVAVDAAGTGHVVWNDANSVKYCQVPRGTLKCAATPVSIAAPLSPVEGSAHVFLPGGSAVLLA